MTDTIAGLLAARADDANAGLVFEDQRWTWAQVVHECAVRSSRFEELGLAGGHIGVLLENVPEYVFVLGAAALSGSVVVGINPTRRGDELARDVRHTDCDVILTDVTQAALVDGLDLGSPVHLVDSPGWQEGVNAHRDAPLPGTLPEPDALYLLIFTSGSTGAPKAVQMSQGRAARTAHAGAVAFTPADVLYSAMPLFHGNALLANLFPALVSGASVVLRARFSASELLPDVRRYGCTYFNYVGRALSYVLATPERPDDADNALKWCLGSEASPRDRKEFRRRFGCFVAEGYSSSEGAVVITPFSGMPTGALGRPAEGTDVAIIDPATGEECPVARFGPDGELLNADEAVGEIVGRSTLSSFEGYYANPEATAERSRRGWYWTGDLGYRDEHGTFFFAGRTADWMRVDGENFAAGPVEQILGRFPGVASVVVYGVPDPKTGDQVMAALELDAGVAFDARAFEAFLAEQSDLGTKWAPRFVRIVTAIPVTATGKVDRKPLRADRWIGADPLWWRPDRGTAYRRLTDQDVADLHAAFPRRGARRDPHVKFAITHPLVTHPYHPDLVSGAGVTTLAQAAEAAGFHGYGFTDHPSPTDRWLNAGGHDALDPFVALGFAAGVTRTLRLIPNIVVLPYRNPFVVAKAAATLDMLSAGRFTLAVGAGYLKGEFAALGVEHAERNELMDEALGVIRAIWTGDDVTVEGRHFSARGITAHPRPVTQPHPPIWIGGNSGRARQRVADHAQGWCPFPAPAIVATTARTAMLDTTDKLAEAIDDLHRRLDAAGRDPRSVDIAFSNPAGGDPASDDFDADAHLEGLAALARLGVTWVQAGVPGDSVAHAAEVAQRYGEQVIARFG